MTGVAVFGALELACAASLVWALAAVDARGFRVVPGAPWCVRALRGGDLNPAPLRVGDVRLAWFAAVAGSVVGGVALFGVPT